MTNSVRDTMALAFSALERMDIAILRRVRPMEYAFFGNVPEFYRELFCDGGDEICLDPWSKSAMLEFFIMDAEALFEAQEDKQLSSGIWREDSLGEQRALQATAMTIDGDHLVVLRCLDEEYLERTRILQRAREHLLERRALNNSLEKFRHKATFDALTGLMNRATFMEHLQEELIQAERRRGVLSLLMLDIDNFKCVNDTYGHLAGDAVLAGMGQLLARCLRRGDLPGRYGGEELVVLAPNVGPDKVGSMAEKLRRAVEEHDFGLPQNITVSIGCFSLRPGDDPVSLISRADAALYEAKRLTKNMVVVR